MAKTKVQVAAGTKLYINNRIFGIATGVEINTTGGQKAIYGLDSPTPFEIAPTATSVKCTITYIKAKSDGGLEGRGVSAPESQVLLAKYISVGLMDRITGSLIFFCPDAMVINQTVSVQNKEVINGTFSIEGLSWISETEI